MIEDASGICVKEGEERIGLTKEDEARGRYGRRCVNGESRVRVVRGICVLSWSLEGRMEDELLRLSTFWAAIPVVSSGFRLSKYYMQKVPKLLPSHLP